MSACRICAAGDQGAYVLKLEGDVRLTMCTALDDYFDKIFNDPDFVSVWVDVTDAIGLDSTTLGMLAQLALKAQEKFHFKPAIFSCDPGINRLLRSMGFEQLFELRSDDCGTSAGTLDIPAIDSTEGEVREKVLAAHKTLMTLNETNHAAFQDLVKTLEAY